MGLNSVDNLNIAEILGNEQDTTLTIKSAPQKIQPIQDTKAGTGEQSVQKNISQPLKEVPVPNAFAENKPGVFNQIGDFLGSPGGIGLLADTAIALDPTGVGGALGRSAKGDVEGSQFNNLIAKMEAGEELTSADVVGLSPAAQSQAFDVVQSKAAAGRAERQLGVSERSGAASVGVATAREKQILGAEEAATATATAKAKAVAALERLKQQGDANWVEKKPEIDVRTNTTTYKILNKQTGKEKIVATTAVNPRDAGVFDQRGGRGIEKGASITPGKLDLIGRNIIAQPSFQRLVKAGNFFGRFSSNTDEEQLNLLRQLTDRPFTEDDFKKMTGQTELSDEDLAVVKDLDDFNKQFNLLKESQGFQPNLPSQRGGGSSDAGGAVELPSQVSPNKEALVTQVNNMNEQQLARQVGVISEDVLSLIDIMIENNGIPRDNRAIVELYVRNFIGAK